MVTLIISFDAFSRDSADEFRQIDAAGDELVIKGQRILPDENYGMTSVPNSQHDIIKLRAGKELHRTTVRIDGDGFRVSPASHLKGKFKHLLLIDSSMVFGEALQENQTLFHLINLKSKLYEAYPVAFYGYGPQQAWVRFKRGKLPLQVKEKSGSALIFTHEGDILRFFGAVSTLNHTRNFPNIKEEDGHFVARGNFTDSGNWLQKFVITYCLRFSFCNNIAAGFDTKITDEQLEIAGRLFDDIAKMYAEQFIAEDFTIIWVGFEGNARRFSKFTKNRVVFFPQNSDEAFPDGHRNPKGMAALSDSLFNSKIVR